MKAYTDIEQSKKLAEILPLETADMYRVFENNAETRVYFGKRPQHAYFVIEHVWSLAALLQVISNIFKYHLDYNGISFILTVGDFEVSKKNIIDACVEIIIYLHKLNLL